jgi:hypothetical protein
LRLNPVASFEELRPALDILTRFPRIGPSFERPVYIKLTILNRDVLLQHHGIGTFRQSCPSKYAERLAR